MSALYCPESEAAYVGCVVESEGCVLDEHRATPEHFFTPGPRIVFAAALALYTAGSPVSRPTVLQRLSNAEIEALGGVDRAGELCAYPSPGQAGHYFGILDDRLSLRRATELGRWIVEEAAATDDAPAFVSQIQHRAQSIESTAATDNVLGAVCDEIEAKLDRMAAGKVTSGFQTGLPGWDAAFGGVLDGQLYALSGRPGLGKTAFMEQMVAKYLAANLPVCVFERDMSPQKLIERMACRALGIGYSGFSKGYMSHDLQPRFREMVAFFRQSPLLLYNPAGLTAERMCSIVRRDARTKGARAAFLDHVQTLRGEKDIRSRLTDASLTIRGNVTDTGIPHIVLAHINRDGSKGRPAAENIKEFDQLYGDCDGMAILWTDTDPSKLEDGKLLPMQFYVPKSRDFGPSEEPMLFNGKLMKFVKAAQP